MKWLVLSVGFWLAGGYFLFLSLKDFSYLTLIIALLLLSFSYDFSLRRLEAKD